MAELDVKVGDRSFRLSCDDGQEDRLRRLAGEFDGRVKAVKRAQPNTGEAQSLVVAALALLDEYDEAKSRWSSMTPDSAAHEWLAAKLDEARRRLEQAMDDES
jgi:cell division protein ZapA